jgi:hypothetical protein
VARVAAAGETNNKDRRQNTLDERAEPRPHHSPPIDPPSLRNRADPGGQKDQGMFDDDVVEEGRGPLVQPRLYQLMREPGSIADRTFEIAFHDTGVEAYVFTFG